MSRSQLPPMYDSSPDDVSAVAWKGGCPSTRTEPCGTMCLPANTCERRQSSLQSAAAAGDVLSSKTRFEDPLLSRRTSRLAQEALPWEARQPGGASP